MAAKEEGQEQPVPTEEGEEELLQKVAEEAQMEEPVPTEYSV